LIKEFWLLRVNPPNNSTNKYMNKSNMQTYIQYPAMIVPIRCTELPMFEGHPLAVTAQLEASHAGAYFGTLLPKMSYRERVEGAKRPDRFPWEINEKEVVRRF